MTLADDLKPIVYSARAIMGQLGMRPHRLERYVIPAETPRDDLYPRVTPIVESGGQSPKIRWLNEEEQAVGGLPRGTVEVGPITPKFTGGGTDVALLRGDDLLPPDKLYYRIVGPHHPDGALYRLTKLSDEKALRIMMQLQPVEQQETP